MQHPDEGLIHAWLDGALPAADASDVETHVASCAECASAVAEARGLIAASSAIVGHLDAVPANVVPFTPRRRRLVSWRNPWIQGAIAAGLVIGLRLYTQYMPTYGGVRELPRVSKAPPTDSGKPELTPIAAPSNPVSPPRVRIADQSAPPPSAQSPALPSLPPPSATLQKATAPAAQPVAAPTQPVRSASAEPTTSIRLRAAESRALAADAGSGSTRAAVGAAGGAARAAAPTAMAGPVALAPETPTTAGAASGCYEMSASTEILPARFALVPDSAAIPGLLSIHYVDADGRPSSRIADLGWIVENGQVVVKTQTREALLTLHRSGSAVFGEGRSGSRNGRVVSCTK